MISNVTNLMSTLPGTNLTLPGPTTGLFESAPAEGVAPATGGQAAPADFVKLLSQIQDQKDAWGMEAKALPARTKDGNEREENDIPASTTVGAGHSAALLAMAATAGASSNQAAAVGAARPEPACAMAGLEPIPDGARGGSSLEMAQPWNPVQRALGLGTPARASSDGAIVPGVVQGQSQRSDAAVPNLAQAGSAPAPAVMLQPVILPMAVVVPLAVEPEMMEAGPQEPVRFINGGSSIWEPTPALPSQDFVEGRGMLLGVNRPDPRLGGGANVENNPVRNGPLADRVRVGGTAGTDGSFQGNAAIAGGSSLGAAVRVEGASPRDAVDAMAGLPRANSGVEGYPARNGMSVESGLQRNGLTAGSHAVLGSESSVVGLARGSRKITVADEEGGKTMLPGEKGQMASPIPASQGQGPAFHRSVAPAGDVASGAAPASAPLSSHRVDLADSFAMAAQVQRLASGGGGTIRVKAMPESLGEVTISVQQTRGSKLNIKFEASTQEARDTLMASLPELKQALAATRFEVGRLEVQASSARALGVGMVTGDSMGYGQWAGSTRFSYGEGGSGNPGQGDDSRGGSAWERYFSQQESRQNSGWGRQQSGYRRYQQAEA